MFDPHNYRGIRLIILVLVKYLNRRFLLWSNDNDFITDAQFGFQPNKGRTETIFCLSNSIDSTCTVR